MDQHEPRTEQSVQLHPVRFRMILELNRIDPVEEVLYVAEARKLGSLGIDSGSTSSSRIDGMVLSGASLIQDRR